MSKVNHIVVHVEANKQISHYY